MLLKAMKLNTGRSESIHISPEFEQVRGPFSGDVKKMKEEVSVQTSAHHTELPGDSARATQTTSCHQYNEPLQRTVSDW